MCLVIWNHFQVTGSDKWTALVWQIRSFGCQSTFKTHTGIKTGFSKKVWKVRRAAATCSVRHSVYVAGGLEAAIGPQWGPGAILQALGFLGKRRTKIAYLIKSEWLKSLSSSCSDPYPPPPSKKNSLQIYTDLKNGPGSWKKFWNQTKVWKFWSLTHPCHYELYLLQWK